MRCRDHRFRLDTVTDFPTNDFGLGQTVNGNIGEVLRTLPNSFTDDHCMFLSVNLQFADGWMKDCNQSFKPILSREFCFDISSGDGALNFDGVDLVTKRF